MGTPAANALLPAASYLTAGGRPPAAYAAPAASTGQGQTRSTLVPGDRFRNYAVVWRRTGVAQVATAAMWDVATGRTAVPVTLSRMEPAYWLASFGYYWRIQIPDTAPAGNYQLTLTPGQTWLFTIARPPAARRAISLPAGATTSAVIARTLTTGANVVLPPGDLTLDENVPVPAGATIFGNGARVTYAPRDGNRALFTIGNYVSIFGLELTEHVGTSDVGMLVNAPAGAVGLVVRNCTIRDGILGFWVSEAVVEGNEFAGGGAVVAPVGLWNTNGFSDTRAGMQPLNFWFGSGTTAAFRHRFTRTPRGTVFQANSGPIDDNLFVTAWHDQVAVDGGGEIYLKENPANRFDRNLIFGTRVTGSSSAVFAFDNEARDNGVFDAYLDGDCEIRLGFAGPGVSGNQFQWVTVPRGRVTCGAGASGNVFDTGAVGGACRSADPTNVLRNVDAPDAVGFTVMSRPGS